MCVPVVINVSCVRTLTCLVDQLACAEILKVGDAKKVHVIELVQNEDLVAVISGRNRHIRLYPMTALNGSDVDAIKVDEAKGCSILASGPIRQGSSSCLCVAMKK